MALTNAPAQGYTQYTFTVTATGPTSVLEFDARQDPYALEFGQHLGDGDLVPQAPAAPTITSFSPDTGVVGDGITDPAILTLTGTAVANSNGECLRRDDAARHGDGQCQRGLELYHGSLAGRGA